MSVRSYIDCVVQLLLVTSYGCFSRALGPQILHCHSGNGNPNNEILKQCFLCLLFTTAILLKSLLIFFS